MLVHVVQKVRARRRLTCANHPRLVDALPAHIHGQGVRHIIGKAAARGGVVDDKLTARAALIPRIAEVQAVARIGKARCRAKGLGAGGRLMRDDDSAIGQNFNAIAAVRGARAVPRQQGLRAAQRVAAHGPSDVERATVQLEGRIGVNLDEVIVPIQHRLTRRSCGPVQIDTVLGAISKSTVARSRVSVIEGVKRKNRHVIILATTGSHKRPYRPDAPVRNGNRSAQGPTEVLRSRCLLHAQIEE